MSTSEPPPVSGDATPDSTGASDRRNADPGNGLLMIFLLSGMALIVLFAVIGSASAVEQLLLGWIYFPFRVVPQMTVDWPTCVVGAICAVAFLVALHRTRLWLNRYRARVLSKPAPPVRWGTTCLCAVAMLLLFVAGTALVGTMHQAVWLVTGRALRSGQSRADVPPVQGLLSKARGIARQSQQRNNLKQFGLGFHNFHDVHDSLPPGGTMDDHGRLLHGWIIILGPYLTISTYGIDFGVPWNESPNDRLYRCAIPMFVNPSVAQVFDNEGYGLSHVAGNVHVLPIVRVVRGENSFLDKDLLARQGARNFSRGPVPLRFSDIRDGTSNTLLAGDAAGNYRPWGHPANVRDPAVGVGKSPEGFGGPPAYGGAQFLMCDGSVRFIANNVDRKVIAALGTPAGGETNGLEEE